MKKLSLILIVAFVALSFISCNKEKSGGSSFLPGTSWETTSGLVASFDNSNIYITGSSGTAAGTYTVTSEVSGVGTYFNIENLTYNGKTYVTGSAYSGLKLMVIYEKGAQSSLEFIQK